MYHFPLTGTKLYHSRNSNKYAEFNTKISSKRKISNQAFITARMCIGNLIRHQMHFNRIINFWILNFIVSI